MIEGREDEKDVLDHTSPCKQHKLTLSRVKKDVPLYFLLQGQLSGARARRLFGKQDLEWLF